MYSSFLESDSEQFCEPDWELPCSTVYLCFVCGWFMLVLRFRQGTGDRSMVLLQTSLSLLAWLNHVTLVPPLSHRDITGQSTDQLHFLQLHPIHHSIHHSRMAANRIK